MTDATRERTRYTRFGLLMVGLLVCALVVAMGFIRVAGATIAPGTMVVDGDLQSVQHPVGGVVTEIRAENGDEVSAGDVLIQLDVDAYEQELSTLDDQIAALEAREARLSASASGTTMAQDTTDVSALWTVESDLLLATRAADRSQISQLSTQIDQIELQIDGLEAQRGATLSGVPVLQSQIATLKAQTSTPALVAQIAETTRQLDALNAEADAQAASISAAHASIREREVLIAQVATTRKLTSVTELEQVTGTLIDLSNQREQVVLEMESMRVLAPVSGTVANSTVTTVGGVLGAGIVAMQIVPSADLFARVSIPSANIDQVEEGQSVVLRFPGLDANVTPEISGRVDLVAQTPARDEASGVEFFPATVAFDDQPLGTTLVSGMPVEAYIQNGDRTIGEYLIKPVLDQFRRAFTED